MANEAKKLKIHLGNAEATSPYVIDLRRKELPTATPVLKQPKTERRHTPKVITRPPRPDEIVTIAFDPTHDLIPTRKELIGQLAECDFVDPQAWLPFEQNVRPLFSGSLSEALDVNHPTAVAVAFTSLQIPESEEAEAFYDAESDEQTFLARPSVLASIHLPHLRLPAGWQKTIAGFVGLSFLLVLPIHAMQQVGSLKNEQEQLRFVGATALQNLVRGSNDLRESDFALAKDDFARASTNFASAKEQMEALSGILGTILRALPASGAKLSTADALISAGDRLSTTAALFSEALEQLNQVEDHSTITKLDLLTLYLERMQPLLTEASQSLTDLDPNLLPSEAEDAVTLIQSTLPSLSASVNQFLALNHQLRTMLGGDGPMRYLVLFQNNTEIRPTGGFIGSYAELTLENGAISEMHVPGGGSYDLQGSLSDFVEAPYALSLLNPRFEFQDANWFPDFSESAQKLLSFYDHAGGPTVDGVLSVNATFVADLLSLLGPVEMDSYGRTITTDNFLAETQKIVELESDKTLNKPKQFIADLAPKLLERVTGAAPQDFLALLQNVGNGLSERDIQLYFTNPELQQTVQTLGWAGKLGQTTGDYLMVVNTNVGGGKTDQLINEQVRQNIEINDDGSVVDTVTITRTHNGNPHDPLGGVNNVNYLRLFVPSGSVLLSASGDFTPPSASLFETSDLPLTKDPDLERLETAVGRDQTSGTDIGTASGKTTFGNWTQTKPGQTSTVRFRYQLPFKVKPNDGWIATLKHLSGAVNTSEYNLLVQKQSGLSNRQTTVTVFPPDSLSSIWSSDEALTQSGVTFDGSTDTSFAELFAKR